MDRVGGGDVEGGIGNLMLKASVYFAALMKLQSSTTMDLGHVLASHYVIRQDIYVSQHFP